MSGTTSQPVEELREDVTEQIRQQATAILMLSTGEPEVTVPNDLGDLDSFSVVQLILSLEDHFLVSLLEDMPTFEGRSFADLADFLLARVRS